MALNEWVPIMRYTTQEAYLVTLTCGHTRKLLGQVRVIQALNWYACYDCKFARQVKKMQELPLICENSPRLR